jgi:hypothetical protein
MNLGDNMDKDTEHIRQWINDNLVMQQGAMKITGQKKDAFNMSVKTGNIVPFVEFGTNRIIRLYLRSDMEEYAKNKRK